MPVETKVLLDEIKETASEQRLGVDFQCAMLEERHKTQECDSEHLSKKIGSTKSGVGACNAERALRMVKLARQEKQLTPYVEDTVAEIHRALSTGGNVMVEGTQGTFLSADVGIGPTKVDDVMVIFKAYVTRVGEGPLEGQLSRDEVLHRGWMEHGTVTGRERRAAPFDFKLAKRAIELNGGTQIALTKLDVLFPSAKGIRDMRDLPREAHEFISKIEQATKTPVTVIGTGASESDIIDRRAQSRQDTTKLALIVKSKKSTSLRG